MLTVNKSAHYAIEIKTLPATETKPTRYQVVQGDCKKKVISQPSCSSSIVEELGLVLERFYEGEEMPKGFDIHPINKGWVAIPHK